MATRSRVVISLVAMIGILAIAWMTLVSRKSSDTDESLFPDPTARTQHRLEVLAMAIDSFARQYRKYPASLRDLSSNARQYEQEVYRFDGWKRPVEYHLQNGGYELRSLGLDGIPDTGDDIRLTGPTLSH